MVGGSPKQKGSQRFVSSKQLTAALQTPTFHFPHSSLRKGCIFTFIRLLLFSSFQWFPTVLRIQSQPLAPDTRGPGGRLQNRKPVTRESNGIHTKVRLRSLTVLDVNRAKCPSHMPLHMHRGSDKCIRALLLFNGLVRSIVKLQFNELI